MMLGAAAIAQGSGWETLHAAGASFDGTNCGMVFPWVDNPLYYTAVIKHSWLENHGIFLRTLGNDQ